MRLDCWGRSKAFTTEGTGEHRVKPGPVFIFFAGHPWVGSGKTSSPQRARGNTEEGLPPPFIFFAGHPYSVAREIILHHRGHGGTQRNVQPSARYNFWYVLSSLTAAALIDAVRLAASRLGADEASAPPFSSRVIPTESSLQSENNLFLCCGIYSGPLVTENGDFYILGGPQANDYAVSPPGTFQIEETA